MSRRALQSMSSGKGRNIITGKTGRGTLSIGIIIKKGKFWLRMRTDWGKPAWIEICWSVAWSDWLIDWSSIEIGSWNSKDSWSWVNSQLKAEVNSQMSTRSSSLSESYLVSDSESELSPELSPEFNSPWTKWVFNVHVNGVLIPDSPSYLSPSFPNW